MRQQPAAGPLRFVFTTIKINKELERIGDYAESVARQALKLSTLEAHPPPEKFVELGNLAVHMLRDAVQAFLDQDAELAKRTMLIEERANTLRNELNAELASLHDKGQVPTDALTPLLTIARRFERVTDQTKNICEEVLYLCTGEFINHPGAEAFRILFVDADNRWLSQLAEGIGTAMGAPRFVFSSAGIAPMPVDTRLVEFMAQKGINVARHTSKTREQVPNWEHYQVVIALCDEARKALPTAPTKTICLTWTARELGAVEGSPETTPATFESAYRFLQDQIQDLVEAIRGEPQQRNHS